jgi:hypothetical protein
MLRKGGPYFFHFCHKLGPVFDVGYLALLSDLNDMPHIFYNVMVR